MYRYIIGIVSEQDSNNITLECNNVGYQVFVSNPYSYELNSEYKVYLYNHIREDENSLYGFKTKEELELFLKLINVKGFFATGSVKGIVDAINRENVLYLTKFPKVGEKIAKQIILDLKGKIEIDGDVSDDSTADLFEVLQGLGYKTSEINKVIKNVDPSLNVEMQVKEALKLLLR